MNHTKLNGVADTLFIPLMARINTSKRFLEYFYDKKALCIESVIPNNIITKKVVNMQCLLLLQEQSQWIKLLPNLFLNKRSAI